MTTLGRIAGALLALGCLYSSVPAQTPALEGREPASDRFSLLYPSRAKTFIKASYDPEDLPGSASEGNDDGFSGVNSCESYRVLQGGTPTAVLAHIEGRRGFMGLFFRNFWSDFAGMPQFPWEFNQTQITVDGAVVHDMVLPDFFRNADDPRGQVAPFSGPFTGHRAGGHLTHTPIVWEDSFQVRVLDDGANNAARFHKVAGTLAPPEGPVPVPAMREWERIARDGEGWPHATPRAPTLQRLRIGPVGSQAIALSGPATILELSCRVPNRVDWTNLWARFYWDGLGTPSVDVPLRLLGGMMVPPYSFAFRSLLHGNNGYNEIVNYFPMHFGSRARLEFVNNGGTPIDLDVTFSLGHGEHPEPWGYFTACYQSGTTVTGQAFEGPRFTSARGMLRLIALETGMDTTGRIPDMRMRHLEGDLLIRVNGNRGDDHTFAATETSVGKWGWYMSPADRPFVQGTTFHSGIRLRALPNSEFASQRIMGTTLVTDPVHFVSGIDIRLEHGVQNRSNADYGLLTFFYLQHEPARKTVLVVDVGDAVSEARVQARFTEWWSYNRTGEFLRDHFFNTPPVTERVRHLRDFYRFQAVVGSTQYLGFGLGFRLDRLGTAGTGPCQADVFVDGQYAGLLHCATHGGTFAWKEGGEVEVEIPRALTDGKTSFTVEVRPRLGTDPLKLARVSLFGYVAE